MTTTTPPELVSTKDLPATSDVLIIGAGPIGLVTALLLARRGHQVTVLERWPQPYPQPRAVHFDDEVARLLADAGIADEIHKFSEPADVYEWRNATGDTLLHFDWSGLGPSGWPMATMMNQPALEDALTRVAQATSGIRVLRGHEAVQLTETDEHVQVLAQDRGGQQHRFTAAWVIGCDGANSFVRTHMPTEMTDLGFFYDWLIIDVVPNEPRVFDPINLQICDPARPTTVVSGGLGRRRWEFMRMPTETAEDLNTEEAAWRFLQPWDMTPQNSTLERHALYTFQAAWADTWRSGRLMLAGDSAHLMPPFAGQGMCSGIRDAANLAWKLDLVLRGVTGADLLDTYGPERGAHVQNAIGMSVELGKVICVTDAEQAAQRDAVMIAGGADPARVLPPLPPSTLTDGVVHRDSSGAPVAGAGVLTPQSRIAMGGRTGPLDDVLGPGFVFICAQDPTLLLSEDQREFLHGIGAHVVYLVPAENDVNGDEAEHIAVDIDNAYLPHLAQAGHIAAIVRPDHYLFGSAATTAQVGTLVTDLHTQLLGTAAPQAQR